MAHRIQYLTAESSEDCAGDWIVQDPWAPRLFFSLIVAMAVSEYKWAIGSRLWVQPFLVVPE